MNKLIPDYQALYNTMAIDPAKEARVQYIANVIGNNKDRYTRVGINVCAKASVPWEFISLIHHMESGGDFSRHLYNGDPLTGRTIHVPIGRPLHPDPPYNWDDAAEDALEYMGYGEPKTWEIKDYLYRLEGYNGYGYQLHNVYTPYIWAGTNHYTKGRFEEKIENGVDHVIYNPDEVSQQIGCAPILKLLMTM